MAGTEKDVTDHTPSSFWSRLTSTGSAWGFTAEPVDAGPLRSARILRTIDGVDQVGAVVEVFVGSASKEQIFRVRYPSGELEHLTAKQVQEFRRDNPEEPVTTADVELEWREDGAEGDWVASSNSEASLGAREVRATPSFVHRRTSAILGQEVLELLGREAGVKQSACGMLLLLLFIVVSANDNLAKAASKVRQVAGEAGHFPYDPSSVVLLASALSVVLGNALAWLHAGKEGLARCWSRELLSRAVLPSSLFTACTLLKFAALAYMPADMVALLDQMSLVLMALLMRAFFGKVYSTSQWTSLALLTLSMLQYMMLRGGDAAGSAELSRGFLVGSALMAVQVLLSAVASLTAERLLKQGMAMSFWEQKACMEVPGTMVGLFSAYVVSPFIMKDRTVLDRGLLHGWSGATACVLALVMGKLWLAGLVAKLVDTVAKQVGSCAALLLLYFELLLLPLPHSDLDMKDFEYRVFVAVSLVAVSILAFAASSQQAREADSTALRLQGLRHWAEQASEEVGRKQRQGWDSVLPPSSVWPMQRGWPPVVEMWRGRAKAGEVESGPGGGRRCLWCQGTPLSVCGAKRAHDLGQWCPGLSARPHPSGEPGPSVIPMHAPRQSCM